MPDSHTFDGVVESVTDLLQEIRSTGLLGLNHAHIRGWFRGQADSSWGLTPGVYRQDFHANDEGERLSKERHMTQDFRAMSAGLLSSPKNEAELYFLQQHYRMPTRLLDWTTSPLAALYFAVETNSPNDAALFMIDAYRLGPDQKGKRSSEMDFQGIASSRDPLFEQALFPIMRWQDAAHFPSFILPVRPDQFDRRIDPSRHQSLT